MDGLFREAIEEANAAAICGLPLATAKYLRVSVTMEGKAAAAAACASITSCNAILEASSPSLEELRDRSFEVEAPIAEVWDEGRSGVAEPFLRLASGG